MKGRTLALFALLAALLAVIVVAILVNRLSTKSGANAPPINFAVSASVIPSRINLGDHATLTAQTVQGARCNPDVIYSTGGRPNPWNSSAQTVGRTGTVSWRWLVKTNGSGGTATVHCTKSGVTRSATAYFDLAR